MGFPTAKVHRANRRKLGRGQYPQNLGTTVTVTAATDNMVLTFARPVVYGGPAGGGIAVTVAGNSISSASQTSPTVIVVVTSGTVAGKAWTFAPNQTNIKTFQGGTVAGASGTFP